MDQRWAWAAIVAGVGMCGCPDGAGAPGDGGEATADEGTETDGGADGGELATPEPPDPVRPPVLTPCPAGWREVPDPAGGPAVCDPWPEGGRAACAEDEVHFPGTPGCRRIGTACPAGEWAEPPEPGWNPRYVRPGAAGGDGTRERPFGTLAAATTGAAAGDVILLARGTYDESVRLPAGVALWGACVAETRVAASAPDELEGTVTAAAAGVVVGNLQVGGERLGIVADGTGASLELREVLVREARVRGVLATHGARLTAAALVVRDTRARPSDGQRGRGLQVEYAANAAVDWAAFEGNRELAVAAFNPATELRLTDVVVSDTRSEDSDGLYGRGVVSQDGARIVIQRGALERNRDSAALAGQNGAVLELQDAVIRDTLGQEADGWFGRALSAQESGRLTATRVLVAGNREFGAIARDPGTTLTLSQAVIRDTAADVEGRWGNGLQVTEDATAALDGVWLEANREVGVAVLARAGVDLTDVTVSGTLGRAGTGTFGRGLNAQEGATVVARRLEVRSNHGLGIVGFDPGTTLDLEDLVVADNESQEADGFFGRGLSAQDGAAASVRRGLLEGNREAGVLAFGPDTVVTLQDVRVRETRERGCAETGSCAGLGVGIGLVSLGGARLDAERFAVLDNALCGVQLAHGQDELGLPMPAGGTMDLREGEVAGHPIGANLQTEGFDTARLMDRTRFRDNERNLDTTELPVPGAAVVFEE